MCQWSGDGFCDDESNIEECDFDGGDCCQDVVGIIDTSFCYACVCKSECHLDMDSYDLIGDMFCDDSTNIEECNFDGGDCCGFDVWTDFCKECLCLEDENYEEGTVVGGF